MYIWEGYTGLFSTAGQQLTDEPPVHTLGERSLRILKRHELVTVFLKHEPFDFIADLNDLFDVHYELLNVAHNWRGVGRALRLHPDLLNRIEASTTDVVRRLERVLSEWLKREYDTTRCGLPSWQLVVAAVAHPAGGKDHTLAEQIAKRHNGIFLNVLSNTLVGFFM